MFRVKRRSVVQGYWNLPADCILGETLISTSIYIDLDNCVNNRGGSKGAKGRFGTVYGGVINMGSL